MASEIITRELYNGSLSMTHNPNARGRAPRYVVTEDGQITKPKGVTTLLGQTLSKDLMQWAVDCSMEYLSDKLPVITANDLKEASQEYIRRRDSGGSTGTEAHALVETYLKGKKVSLVGASTEAKNAYNAFVGWFEDMTPEVVNVEEIIYSREYEYAGTYDCMLKIDGLVYLCDLKTTNASKKAPNGVYAEYFLQLGAYAAAHEEQRAYEEENGGTKLPEIEGLMIISAKKDGKLDISTNDDVDMSVQQCGDLFKQVVNLNKFLADTTKVLGG